MSAELEHTPSTQEEAETAYACEQQAKDALRRGKEAIWDLSESLYWFNEINGWTKLGYESLADWLADPEITLSHGTYRRYVRTWKKMVVDKKIEPQRVRLLEPSKAAIVADKVASNEVLVEDALADVEALGAKDLREKYYGRRESNVEQDEPLGANETPLGGVIVPDPVPYDGPDDAEDPFDGVGYDAADLAVASDAVLHGDVVDAEIVGNYDWPAWFTEGNVRELLDDVQQGVDCGAQFPRIKRRSAQVAVELAKAWLATHTN